MRENLRMTDDLISRIDRRLAAIKKSANAACENAGLHRDFIRTIRRGKSTEPSATNMVALARALDCRAEWLVSGDGPETDDQPTLSGDESYLLEAYRALKKNKDAALTVIQSLVMSEDPGGVPLHEEAQSPSPTAGSDPGAAPSGRPSTAAAARGRGRAKGNG